MGKDKDKGSSETDEPWNCPANRHRSRKARTSATLSATMKGTKHRPREYYSSADPSMADELAGPTLKTITTGGKLHHRQLSRP
jgi:hypothetical protein